MALAAKIGENRFCFISMAVAQSEVILLATPPTAIFDLLEQLGDVSGKIIIDATNSLRQGPEPYATVFHCLADKTKAAVVKCFNTTGYENMLDPTYQGEGIDMFMAGDADDAKTIARQLALDIGFKNCYDFGKADKVPLLEQLAFSWINLAIMQGEGRNIAFKLVKR
jgi:predicted dinucleotide-binding enzyme